MRWMRLFSPGIEKYQDVELKAVNKTSASDDLKDESAPDKGGGDEAAD